MKKKKTVTFRLFYILETHPNHESMEDVDEFHETPEIQADDISPIVNISENENGQYSAKEEEGPVEIIQQSNLCSKNRNFILPTKTNDFIKSNTHLQRSMKRVTISTKPLSKKPSSGQLT